MINSEVAWVLVSSYLSTSTSNSSSAPNNTRSRLSSRLFFRFLWLWIFLFNIFMYVNWNLVFIDLFVQQCWIRLYSAGFTTPKRRQSFEILRNKNLINASWVCLGFGLDLSDICLLDRDLRDTDLDLLETDIDSLSVNFCWSPRCLGDDFKTYLQDV